MYSEKNVPEARWDRIFQKQIEKLPDCSDNVKKLLNNQYSDYGKKS